MNGWQIAGIVIGVIIVLLVLMNARDLYRYMKINSM